MQHIDFALLLQTSILKRAIELPSVAKIKPNTNNLPSKTFFKLLLCQDSKQGCLHLMPAKVPLTAMLRMWCILNCVLTHFRMQRRPKLVQLEAFVFTYLCRVCFGPNEHLKMKDAKYIKYPVIKNTHKMMQCLYLSSCLAS